MFSGVGRFDLEPSFASGEAAGEFMTGGRNMTSLKDYVLHRGRFEGSALAKDGGPWFAEVDKLQSRVEADGGTWRSFSHYDYLGLSDRPDVIEAASEALHTFGPGVGASRLVGGERSAQGAFEADLSGFLGAEAALSLISGYLTNYSIIPHLMGKRDLVLYDESCHNSLLMGINASGAKAISIAHNDTGELANRLALERDNYNKCLIVTEGLFSMDGDIPNLPEIIRLKHAHGCWLMVDEAHSIGVLGKTGRGVSEHFDTPPREIDLLIGTLSKTFVSAGGFVAADKEVIWYLKYSLGGFVYSVGPTPASTASAHAALKVLRREPARVRRLQRNSEQFLQMCRQLGLETGQAIGRAVVPVFQPDYRSAFEMAELLLQYGIYVPPVVHVGVPKSRPRLRFFISASHCDDDFRAVAEIVTQRLRPAAE